MSDTVEMAFVGPLVADVPSRHGPAFSRAGNMFQLGLVTGLQRAGVRVTVLGFAPASAFPRSRRIWIRGGVEKVSDQVETRLVGYVNLVLLKQLWVGVAIGLRLLAWGWRARRGRRVVYEYNLTMPPGLIVWTFARAAGARVFASLNDVNVPGQTVPDTLPFQLDFKAQGWAIRLLDGLVVVADQIARDFAPGRRYLRLDGGIRAEAFAPAEPPPADPDRPFVIATAGSLDKVNGIAELLAAFALLRGDRFRLRIAGTGPLAEQVRVAAARDARIEYLGFQDFAAVLELYRRADLLVNLRLTKALDTRYFFPSKLMEFLASGVPVLTTCTGHVKEEYGAFALLAEEETPESVAAVIARIAELPEDARRGIGARARTYMLTEKTWDAQGARLARFIREEAFGDGRCAS
jgi:glycosyltransferase involved in cell wall biosynthesis